MCIYAFVLKTKIKGTTTVRFGKTEKVNNMPAILLVGQIPNNDWAKYNLGHCQNILKINSIR